MGTGKILPEEKCIGCGLCVISCPQQCIMMRRNREGFLYPVINTEECISCKRCEEVCSRRQQAKQTENKALFAAKNKCENDRNNSSSGGVFILLAERILEMGGSVCGATYDDQFKVCHRIVSSKEELSSLCGAKYSQSTFYHCVNDIRKSLQEDNWVLFVGTPCQVEALSFLLSEEEKEHLLLVDFVCHGVPSPLVLEQYFEELKTHYADGGNIISVNMRDKETGWSRYSYCMNIQFDNGTSYKMINGEDPFLRGFVSNLYLRKTCENCTNKKTNRASDLTLGDFWGAWDITPEFDDNKGISLLVVHTDKGNAFWHSIQDAFETIVVSEEQITAKNPSITDSSKPHENKSLFWDLFYQENSVIDSINKCLSNPAPGMGFLVKLKKRIRKVVSRRDNL